MSQEGVWRPRMSGASFHDPLWLPGHCILTIRFWVVIRTHPRHSSSLPHICAAIYLGSTSLQPLPSTLHPGHHPIRLVTCHQSTILRSMGHCILREGRWGECGAAESKSIQIGTRCHSATADNASDLDNKVATWGRKILYRKRLVSGEILSDPFSISMLTSFILSHPQMITLNSSWSIHSQTVLSL